jgi:hypothetical protein
VRCKQVAAGVYAHAMQCMPSSLLLLLRFACGWVELKDQELSCIKRWPPTSKVLYLVITVSVIMCFVDK